MRRADRRGRTLSPRSPLRALAAVALLTAATLLAPAPAVAQGVSLTVQFTADSLARSAGEGSLAITYSVTSEFSLGSVVLDYAFTDGTADGGPAPYPNDYPGGTGSVQVTLIANQPVSFDLPHFDDPYDEVDETYSVQLTGCTPTAGGSVCNIGAQDTAQGTITDDDALAQLSITGPTAVTEPSTGTTMLTYTAQLSTPAGRDVTYDYQTVVGTATAGTDYVALPLTSDTFTRDLLTDLTPTTRTFDVTLNGDALDENPETFQVRVLPTGGTASSGTPTLLTVTIADDANDLPPAITALDFVSPASGTVDEPAGGSTPLIGRLTFSPASGRTANFAVTTAGFGTDPATSGSDYSPPAGAISCAAGSTQCFFTIPILADGAIEVDEQFQIDVVPGNAPNGEPTLSGNPAALTATIHDPTKTIYTISPTAPSVAEGAGTVGFTITRSDTTPIPTTVLVDTVQHADAVAGEDYVALVGEPFTFAPTELTKTFSVQILDDAVEEDDEQFRVELRDPPASDLGDRGTPFRATVRITDTDKPTVNVTAFVAAAPEDATGPAVPTFRVSRDPASSDCEDPLTVTLATILDGADDADAGIDYAALPVTVDLPGGGDCDADAVLVALDPTVDGFDDGDETVHARLLPGASYGVGAADATVTIEDIDDPVVQVTATVPTVSEDGGGSGQFTVTRLQSDGDEPLVVQFTASGSAVAGADYAALPAAVTFAAGVGQLARTVAVTPIPDRMTEPDRTVTWTVAGDGPGAYSVQAPGFATVTITNDDRPLLLVSVLSDSLTENDPLSFGEVAFAIDPDTTLCDGDLTVGYAVSDNGTSGALDYVVVDPDGDADGTFTLTAADCPGPVSFYLDWVNDATAEPREWVDLALLPSAAYDMDASGATFEIVDDDLPLVTPTAVVAVAEPDAGGSTFLTVTFRRTNTQLDAELDFTFEVQPGWAAEGDDYFVVGPIDGTFGVGAEFAFAQIEIVGDDVEERDEGFTIHVGDVPSVYLGGLDRTVTILDDDLATLTLQRLVPGGAAAEAVSGAAWALLRTDSDCMDPLSIALDAGDFAGTALFGADYEVLSGFDFGATCYAEAVLDLLDDDVAEVDETILLTVPPPGGADYTLAPFAPGENVLTLEDDGDLPELSLYVDDGAGFTDALDVDEDSLELLWLVLGRSDCMTTYTVDLERSGLALDAAGAFAYEPRDYALGVLQVGGGGACSAATPIAIEPDPASLPLGVLYEGPEDAVLALPAAPALYAIGDGEVTLTITEASPPPTIIVAAVGGIVRFDEPGGSLTAAVQLSHMSALPASAGLSFTGEAELGTDYDVNREAVDFDPGDLFVPLQFTGLDDIVRERDEDFQVEAVEPSLHALNGSAPLVLTVVDDDIPGFRLRDASLQPVDLGVPVVTAFEGETVQHLLSLRSPPTGAVDVRLDTLGSWGANATLTATDDLDPMDGEILLTYDDTTWFLDSLVTFRTPDDDLVGPTRSFFAQLYVSASADPEYLTEVRAVTLLFQVLDDDTPGLVPATPGGLTVREGDAPSAFAVCLAKGATGNVRLQATLPAAAAGQVELVGPAAFDLQAGQCADQAVVRVRALEEPAGMGVVEAAQAVAVEVSVVPAFTDDDQYRALAGEPPLSIPVTVQDNDVPEVIVDPAALTLVEGQEAWLSLRLGNGSAETVVVEPVVLATGLLTVSGLAAGPLAFEPGSGAQPVRVFAPSDSAFTGTRVVQAQFRATQAGYQAQVSVLVTLLDDEDARLLAVPDVPLALVEGGQGVAAIQLNGMPPADVVVDAALVGAPAGLTLLPSQLRFTPATWDAPRSVTVFAAQDDLADGALPFTLRFTVNDAASHPSFAGEALEVAGLVAEDDAPSLLLRPVDGTAALFEAGGEEEVEVVLGSEPTVPFALDFAIDGAQATVTPAQLSMSAANWRGGAVVRVSALQDLALEPPMDLQLTALVSGGAPAAEYTGRVASLALPLADDDAPAIVALPTGGGTTVAERGAEDAIEVRLASRPAGPVRVQVDLPAGLAADAAALTFTGSDWDDAAAHAVRVWAVDNAADDGTRIVTVAFRVDASAAGRDDAYDAAPPVQVPVTILDDDSIPTVSLVPASASVTEGGTLALAVRLSEPASQDVLVTLTAEGTAIRGTDYLLPSLQVGIPVGIGEATVAIPVLPDDDNEGPETVVLGIHGVAGGTEAGQQSVELRIEDDPVPFLAVDVTPAVQPENAGAAFRFGFRLSEPSPVPVQALFDFEGQATPGVDFAGDTMSPLLEFLPGQTVVNRTFTVLPDSLDEADEELRIRIVDATNADTGALDAATARITDNDPSPTLRVNASPAVVTEGGDVAVVRFLLSAVSGRDVTASFRLSGTATDGTDYTISEGLFVTIPEGATGADVVVIPLDDDEHEGTETLTVTATEAAGATLGAGVAATVQILNRDRHLLLLDHTGGASVVHEALDAGRTDLAKLQLAEAPLGPVLVAVTSSDPSQVTAAPGLFAFGPENWTSPQSILLTAVDDADLDGDATVTLTATVRAAGTTPEYRAAAPETLQVAAIDDEVLPPLPPEPEEEPDFDITENLEATAARGGATLSWTGPGDADGYQLWRQSATGGDWQLVTRRFDAGAFSVAALGGERLKLTYYNGTTLDHGYALTGPQAERLPGWDGDDYVVLGPPLARDSGATPAAGGNDQSIVPWVVAGLSALLAIILAVALILREASRRASRPGGRAAPPAGPRPGAASPPRGARAPGGGPPPAQPGADGARATPGPRPKPRRGGGAGSTPAALPPAPAKPPLAPAAPAAPPAAPGGPGKR